MYLCGYICDWQLAPAVLLAEEACSQGLGTLVARKESLHNGMGAPRAPAHEGIYGHGPTADKDQDGRLLQSQDLVGKALLQTWECRVLPVLPLGLDRPVIPKCQNDHICVASSFQGDWDTVSLCAVDLHAHAGNRASSRIGRAQALSDRRDAGIRTVKAVAAGSIV